MGIYDREYIRGESRGVSWFAGPAPVCRTLVVINVAVFLLEHTGVLDHHWLWEWFAATPQGVFHGRVWQLVTATFLHADLLHLIGNMLFLWFVGQELESMYGQRDFLALYLSAAAVSTLAWAGVNEITHGSDRFFAPYMVGASGAVLALVVIYALYFPRREVLFMFVLPVQVWVLVVAFVGYDLLMFLKGGQTGTAVEAHLAGAAYGWLVKRFEWRLSRLTRLTSRRPRLRVVHPDPRERPVPRPAPASPAGPTWLSEPAGMAKPAGTAVVTPEQLDQRLDEVLAKIARHGRASLSEEENRVLDEASQRARNRRSHRL